MKTKLKRTLLLSAALLGAVVGCGGNNESGAPSTYVYESALPVVVSAQTCTLMQGPITVGAGTMKYAIEDAAGTDAIRAVVIADSFYSISACDFPAGVAKLDVSFVGSKSDAFGVDTDAYDFVVTCGDTDVDCSFDLSWSAIY